jgi:opacity protein-like surface antigen
MKKVFIAAIFSLVFIAPSFASTGKYARGSLGYSKLGIISEGEEEKKYETVLFGLGYGVLLNDNVSIGGVFEYGHHSIDGGNIDVYTLGIEARYLFTNSTAFVPYLGVGLDYDNYKLSGGDNPDFGDDILVPTFTIGSEFGINDLWSLDLNFKYKPESEFVSYKHELVFELRNISANLGVSYKF